MRGLPFLPLFLLALLPPLAGAVEAPAPPGDTLLLEMVGRGTAPSGTPPAAARVTALALAKRDAAERGLGASVSVEALPDVRRVVSSLEGSLTYRVLREGEGLPGGGSGYTVVILARLQVPRYLIDRHPLSEGERETWSGFRPLLEILPWGRIDWQEGFLYAEGVGEGPSGTSLESGGRDLMAARRAAVADAQGKALEMVAGIRVDSENRVKGLTGKDQALRYRVEGLVREAEVASEEPGRRFRVTLRVPLHGIRGVGVLFHGLAFSRAPSLLPCARGGAVVGAPTGLVLDARGTGLRPALHPRVLDPAGAGVYSVEMVDPDALVKRGMAGYALAEADPGVAERIGPSPLRLRVAALGDGVLPLLLAQDASPVPKPAPRRKRQGDNPLKVKGLESKGALRANIVISAEDARRLGADPAMGEIFRKGRVIVLVDPGVGGSEGLAL